MPSQIKWTDIIEEAEEASKGYRAVLVAVFKKYEGQPTDEKDAQGRTVKVTQRSFAEHLGVDHSTFSRWVKRSLHGATPEASKQKTREIEQWHVRSAARKNPEALVAVINELPEAHAIEIANKIVRRQKERRLAELVEQGADFSEAGRKARRAATAEALEPLRDSLRALGCMVVVTTLEQAAAELRNVVGIDDDERREIDAAVDDVILARTEMHMKLEVS